MKLTIDSAQLTAKEVLVGDVLAVQEIRISGKEMALSLERGGPTTIRELDATLIVTEASLNRLLSRNNIDGVSDLEIATLKGKFRISGKRDVLGPVAVPFTLTAVPEIIGGTQLRLKATDLEVVGLFSMPGGFKNWVEGKINETLAAKFDASKLPVPFRLTNVTVEPGRIHLSASLNIDLPATATDLVQRDQDQQQTDAKSA